MTKVLDSLNVVSYSMGNLTEPSLMAEVKGFFSRHTRKSFHPTNVVFMARSEDVLVGLVRLCFEERRYILRSMEVKPEFRRQNIGLKLMNRVEAFVTESGIQEVYCLPYEHLVDFYGKSGFKQIADGELPGFLNLRLQAYRRKRPDSKFCGMVLLRAP